MMGQPLRPSGFYSPRERFWQALQAIHQHGITGHDQELCGLARAAIHAGCDFEASVGFVHAYKPLEFEGRA